jgi:hypothetical protein
VFEINEQVWIIFYVGVAKTKYYWSNSLLVVIDQIETLYYMKVKSSFINFIKNGLDPIVYKLVHDIIYRFSIVII